MTHDLLESTNEIDSSIFKTDFSNHSPYIEADVVSVLVLLVYYQVQILNTLCSRYAGQMGEGAQKVIDHYLDIDPENIRTFSIIAHVDHGKSTLADAMMKYSGNILKDAPPQFLDNLEVFYYPFGGLV